MMRPLLLLVAAAAMFMGVAAATLIGDDGAEAGEVVSGDANCNGTVDAVDAALVLQFVAGQFSPLACPEAADVNGDGSVNAVDAALILQYIAGLIDELPVGGPIPTDTATPLPPTNTPIAPTLTNTPAVPTATNTPVAPTATSTSTPSLTGTLLIRKEILDGLVVVDDSAPGWEIHIYFDEDCMGEPFLTTTTAFDPLMVGLSPGDYSVEEVMQPGYAAVSDTCINVENLDAGEVVEVVFQNEEV